VILPWERAARVMSGPLFQRRGVDALHDDHVEVDPRNDEDPDRAARHRDAPRRGAVARVVLQQRRELGAQPVLLVRGEQAGSPEEPQQVARRRERGREEQDAEGAKGKPPRGRAGAREGLRRPGVRLPGFGSDYRATAPAF
jgi:hypothetical protein